MDFRKKNLVFEPWRQEVALLAHKCLELLADAQPAECLLEAAGALEQVADVERVAVLLGKEVAQFLGEGVLAATL